MGSREDFVYKSVLKGVSMNEKWDMDKALLLGFFGTIMLVTVAFASYSFYERWAEKQETTEALRNGYTQVERPPDGAGRAQRPLWQKK